MRLYLDSSVIIYSVEGSAEARDAVIEWIQEAEGAGQLVTSQLSRLECRVKPLRERDDLLLARFDNLFASPGLELRHIDAEIIDRATDIRARHGFRTPDAIHLATAVAAECDTFLTGDRTLVRFEDLHGALVGSAPTA